MKGFFAECKKIFSGSKTEPRDVSRVVERVDAQIGRAVTRLSER